VAVLNAVRDWQLDPVGFDQWAVIAAPRHLGLSAFRSAFAQFLSEGAWGVAPLLVSSHSLHSPSGAISQALGAHGPNLGVGGAAGSEEQALLAAANLLEDPSISGVWVVLTGCEYGTPADGSETPSLRNCEALALALKPLDPDWTGSRLWLKPRSIALENPESTPHWRRDAGSVLPLGPNFRAGRVVAAEEFTGQESSDEK
jgi:hypothetical protein